MNKEDYFKYYIQGSDHYLIPKDVFDELFDEMESWKEDTQKYKEVIYKLENKIKMVKQYDFDRVGRYELLELLKEVE